MQKKSYADNRLHELTRTKEKNLKSKILQ